jgi:flagellar biosynthesis/type III secretory pathway chaperone
MDQVETLCAVLDEEERVCAALVAVLRREQEAIVGLRSAGIIACLEERQLLQEELVGLAARRRQLIRGVAAAHGTGTASATVLLPVLPPDPREKLRAGLRRLRRALLEARGIERQNALLVSSSQETIGDVLRAVRALAPGARYGADAQLAASAAASERVSRHV